MLGIKVNNEYLELNPGLQLDIQQENPFLQFGDEAIGDFSLPFEVLSTPTNLRLLEYSGLLQKRINNAGIDAQVYDNGLQHSIGKVKFEKPNVNIQHANSGSVSCYYLSAISNFWQDIKGKRLRDINVGGTRTFPWLDFTFNNTGWWAHVTNVLNGAVNAYDYAFYPVINKSFDGFGFTEIMNRVKYNSISARVEMEQKATNNKKANAIVPFPYLHYVLRKAMEHVGWSIEGAILSDPAFLKATMLNFLAVDYGFWHRSGTSDYTFFGIANIEFNLADHLPDISIAEFLIALKKRLGWWFDFDRKNKVMRIRSLGTVAASEIKDLSVYASPLVVKTVNKEPKIYALRNSFSGEYANGNPDFTSVSLNGTVNAVTGLPAASSSNQGQVYLVVNENTYYICRQSEDSPYPYLWEIYAYNVYDYAPEGTNEDITTSATTVGNEPYNSYMDFCPRMDQAGIWPRVTDTESDWNTILVFYHGKLDNRSGTPIPFASNGIYDPNGNQVANWSLCFECKTQSGTDVGLYERQYRAIFAMLASPEQMEVTLQLSKADYLNLKFSDIISIKGVRMYLKTIKAVVPYKGSITVEGVRI